MPEREARVVLDPLLVDTWSTLNGGLAITKSNLPSALVQVFVVAVALPDVAGEAVDGEVHLGRA